MTSLIRRQFSLTLTALSAAFLLQASVANDVDPIGDAQVHARALLSPPITHSAQGVAAATVTPAKHRGNRSPDAQSLAQDLLLGRVPHVDLGDRVVVARSNAPVTDRSGPHPSRTYFDAQESARRLILGQTEQPLATRGHAGELAINPR
jgi:hypothetical protein